MNEIDMNKLDVAIKYIRRMSEGKNPVNNQPAEGDVLENVNVVRCLYFVADVLEQVRENGGIKKTKGKISKTRKIKFSYDILQHFQYTGDKSISPLVNQINSLIVDKNMKKMTCTKITSALKEEGYLTEKYSEETKKDITVPTQRGEEIGIYCDRRESVYGNIYYIVIYNEKAQLFLKENLEQLLMNED